MVTAALLLTASFKLVPLSNVRVAKFATRSPGSKQNAPPRSLMFWNRIMPKAVLLTADDAQSFQVPVLQSAWGNTRQSSLVSPTLPMCPLKLAFAQKQSQPLGQSEAADGAGGVAACACTPERAARRSGRTAANSEHAGGAGTS
jgi:hypothetical protein